jgi:hypothetical protein
MSCRLFISAILYPICQTVLLGTGLIAVAILAGSLSDVGSSLVRVTLASIVIAAPVSWALAPVLASAKEKADME